MEQQEGFDPSASTLATLRSTWLSYGCMFLRIVGPPVRGTIRGKLLKSIHRAVQQVSSRQRDHCIGGGQRMPFAVCAADRVRNMR